MRWYKDGQIIRENQELEIILFRLFPFIVEWFVWKFNRRRRTVYCPEQNL